MHRVCLSGAQSGAWVGRVALAWERVCLAFVFPEEANPVMGTGGHEDVSRGMCGVGAVLGTFSACAIPGCLSGAPLPFCLSLIVS